MTRSTLTLTPPDGFVDFDLTSLAQSNIANGNLSMTVRLDVVGTPSSTMTFVSSESTSNTSRHPQIHLEYVDNVDGILPPSQPTLSAPADGAAVRHERLPTRLRRCTDLDVGRIARCNRLHPDLVRTQRRELIPFVGGQRVPDQHELPH